MPLTLNPVSIEPYLAELLKACLAALAHDRHGKTADDEVCGCLEILRRAAQRDQMALAVLLLQISYPYIAKHCPPDLLACVQDVQQETAIRLLRRLTHPDSPYQVTSFPAYLSYLSLTVRSVTMNMLEREWSAESLERLAEEAGLEPPETDNDADSIIMAVQALAALPDPLQRECVRRRYLLGESPAEIAAALQAVQPGITKEQVYRLVERGLRWLRDHLDRVIESS